MYCRQKSRFRQFQLETPPAPDLGRSRAPFWEAFGPQDASKTASRAPKTRPRAPKRPPRPPQERPRGLPGRPKRPPGPLQEAFRMPRDSRIPLGSHLGPISPQFSTPFGRKNHPPTSLRTTFRMSVRRHPQLPEQCQEPAKNNHLLHWMTTAIADRIAEPRHKTRGRRSIAAWRPTITKKDNE